MLLREGTMPEEIRTKMGIAYKTLPDERMRQCDQELLAMIYSTLNAESQNLIKSLLDEEYLSYIERKIERIKSKSEGQLVNLSEV